MVGNDLEFFFIHQEEEESWQNQENEPYYLLYVFPDFYIMYITTHFLHVGT